MFKLFTILPGGQKLIKKIDFKSDIIVKLFLNV